MHQPNRLKHKKKKEVKTRHRTRELWDDISRSNVHIIGISKGENRGKKAEEIFEDAIVENFPKLMTDTKPHNHKKLREYQAR